MSVSEELATVASHASTPSDGRQTRADRRVARQSPAHYLPGLDALRSIAVLAVVLFHLDLSFIPGGYLGVSLFFTLSGFLIGRNLLREIERTGRVALGDFWSRRARRLFPAAWFVLAAIAVASAVSSRVGRGIGFNGGDVLASLGNVANWRFLNSGASYASLFRAPSPVLHFWSLAIEEQAYVFVALLLAGLAWRFRRRSTKLIGLVAGLLAIVSWLLPLAFGMSVTRTYYGTDTRIGEILAGVALACWRQRTTLHINKPSRQWGWTVISVATFAALCHWVTASSSSIAGGLLPLVSLLSCALILIAISPGSPLARVGATPVVASLGRISYVVYLVHWPVILVVRWQRVSLGSITSLFAVVALMALIAWFIIRFVELPVRSRRWSRRTLATAAMLTVATIGAMVTIWQPPRSAADRALDDLEQQSATFGRDEAPPTDVTTSASRSTSVATTSSAPPSTERTTTSSSTGRDSDDARPATRSTAVPTRVTDDVTDSATTTDESTSTSAAAAPLLRVRALGDSILFSLALATPQPNDTITYVEGPDDLAIGCGVTDFGDDQPAAPCGDRPTLWVAATPAVAADVAVIMSCQWETIARELPGAGSPSHLGEPLFDDYVLQSYANALDELLTSGVPKVLWVRCPYPSGTVGVDGLSQDFLDGRDPARFDVLNGLIDRAVADFPGQVCTVSFDAWMNGRVDDAALRPDGEHYDTQLAGEAGQRFAEDVAAAYRACT